LAAKLVRGCVIFATWSWFSARRVRELFWRKTFCREGDWWNRAEGREESRLWDMSSRERDHSPATCYSKIKWCF
jgi:hypothetical protein